jgi:hypothetical protein
MQVISAISGAFLSNIGFDRAMVPVHQVKVHLEPGDIIQASATMEVTDTAQTPVGGWMDIELTSDPVSNRLLPLTQPLGVLGGAGTNITPEMHHYNFDVDGSFGVFNGPAGDYYVTQNLQEIEGESRYNYPASLKIDMPSSGITGSFLDVTILRPDAPDGTVAIPETPMQNAIVGQAGRDTFLQDTIHNVTAPEVPGGNIYKWDGTADAPVLLGNPGSDWSAVGAGMDGEQEALLLQNAAGEVWEWLLNGNQISASQMLGTPGSDWRVVGTGNFEPANLDVLLQSSSSGEVWEWQTHDGKINVSQSMGSPGSDWHVVGTGQDTVRLQSNMTGHDWQWTINGGGSIAASVPL